MTDLPSTMLRLANVSKTFVMHLQGGARLPVVQDVSFEVRAGECVVLGGPSGTGKSSILKMIYGNYLADRGKIEIAGPQGWVDIVGGEPRNILALRATTLGYVSQFLRAIPRISSIDLVTDAACNVGANNGPEREKQRPSAAAAARRLLHRLNIPEHLWSLPPATFSGGEQQRINIARGFAAARPILLLDEPTASLDGVNRNVVVELIREQKAAGAAIIGIFHDQDVREAVGDRTIDVTAFAPKAPLS